MPPNSNPQPAIPAQKMPSLMKKRTKGEPLESGFSCLEEGVWGLLIAAILRGTRVPNPTARVVSVTAWFSVARGQLIPMG
ncbi:MAG TPA: hypothetical protein VL522_19425 [Bordetella sp.]|nr:hypothetical protein [Bordetella sp.]